MYLTAIPREQNCPAVSLVYPFALVLVPISSFSALPSVPELSFSSVAMLNY